MLHFLSPLRPAITPMAVSTSTPAVVTPVMDGSSRIWPPLGVDVYGPGISSVPGDFPYTRMTGSSIAAAHVAGAAACLYSWGYVKGNEPSINSLSIKAYLTLGADRIASYRYPNPEWGYGMLNLYQSFLAMRE